MSTQPISAEQLASKHLASILAPGAKSWCKYSVEERHDSLTAVSTLELVLWPEILRAQWALKMPANHLIPPRTLASRTVLPTNPEIVGSTSYYQLVIDAVETFAAQVLKEYTCWSLEHCSTIAREAHAPNSYFDAVCPFGVRLSNINWLIASIKLIEPEDLPRYILLAQAISAGHTPPGTAGWLADKMQERLSQI